MDIVPVIQADRVLWHVLLGMPEANRARRLQGLPIVEPLALLAAHRIAGQAELREALQTVTGLFALDGENSMERFERLAVWFRKDTGYLAPGKDQPMCGADQPDGDELRAIYDSWFLGKVQNARLALSQSPSLNGEGK